MFFRFWRVCRHLWKLSELHLLVRKAEKTGEIVGTMINIANITLHIGKMTLHIAEVTRHIRIMTRHLSVLKP